MKKSLPILAVLFVVAVAYGGLLVEEDLGYVIDDLRFVEQNDALVETGSILRFFTDPTTAGRNWRGIYRPLRTLDFSLDRRLTDGWSSRTARIRWMHLRSLAFHLLTVLLLYLLLTRWTKDRVLALLGAAVFGLHPVQVESTAWVTSRGDVLCGVLFLLTLLAHQRVRRFGWRAILTGALLALALLGKEAAVVFPAAAVLSDWLFRDGRRIRVTFRRWPSYLLYAGVCVAYVGVWLLLHRIYQGEVWHVPERWGGSFLGSVQGFGLAVAYYLRLILLPVDLAFDYYLFVPGRATAAGIACLVGLAALLAWAVLRLVRRGGAGPFALLWLLVALFPVSGLVVPLGHPTAERFLYLPMIGISLWAGALLARAWRTGFAGRSLAVLLLLGLGAATFSRALVWKDLDSLWGRTLARGETPRGTLWLADRTLRSGQDLLAEVQPLLDRGETGRASRTREEALSRIEEARAGFFHAVELWGRTAAPPRSRFLCRASAAICLHSMGRHEEGLEEAEAVLREDPDLPMGRYARAVCLVGVGRTREAVRELEALSELPQGGGVRRNAAEVWMLLAQDYLREDNRARATQCLVRSMRIRPLPAALLALEQIREEFQNLLRPLEAAVKRDPTDGESWLGLASTYAAYGSYDDARRVFGWLLSEEQGGRRPEILYPYALYFWQWRDTAEGYRRAAELYEEILSGGTDYPEAREQLERCRARLDGGKEKK